MDKTMQKFISDYQRAIERRRRAREIAYTIAGLVALAFGAIGLVSIFIVLDVVMG